MNSLFQTICRIGIFMICAQTVIHFRPQESYEKYLKLLVSAMVLIQIFLPVSRLLFHGNSEDLEAKSREFLEGLEAEMSAAERKALETDALLEEMTLEEIRRRVGEEDMPDDAGDHGRDAAHGMADEEDDTPEDTVQIERIQVGEIRVQLQTESPETVPAE